MSVLLELIITMEHVLHAYRHAYLAQLDPPVVHVCLLYIFKIAYVCQFVQLDIMEIMQLVHVLHAHHLVLNVHCHQAIARNVFLLSYNIRMDVLTHAH